MRALAALLVATLVLSGCSDGPKDEPSEGSSSTPTGSPGSGSGSPGIPANASALPGSQFGRTDGTPVVELGPGLWSLDFEQEGQRQFVLRLGGDLDPQGYSISGTFTLVILPMDFAFEGCEAVEVSAVATGLVGLPTGLRDLDKGDYFVVLHNDGASAQFTWQVGSSDEETDLAVTGERGVWTIDDQEPNPSPNGFAADLPAGLQFLLFSGSSGPLTQSSRITHTLGDPAAPCVSGEDSGDLSPTGGTLRVGAVVASATEQPWSGGFQSTQVVPTQPSLRAQARILTPPSLR